VELSKEREKLVVVTFSLVLSLSLREPTFPNASRTDYKDHIYLAITRSRGERVNILQLLNSRDLFTT